MTDLHSQQAKLTSFELRVQAARAQVAYCCRLQKRALQIAAQFWRLQKQSCARSTCTSEFFYDDVSQGLGVAPHLDVGVLLPQVARAAGDGAAGADARHEDVDLAISALPDLRPRGLVVHLRMEGLGGFRVWCQP